MVKRVTVPNIQEMKRNGERIPVITAYDYPTARLVDEAGIPMILVGDSLGMTVLGYDSTLPVTMEDMLHHIKAVARGSQHALIVGDMPFMSYQSDVPTAIRNAGRLLQEGGAQTVKLEGGETVAETVRRIVECGIPVMGHIGLTPQSVNQLGGYKVQGRTPKAAARLLRDAQALEEAGAFAVVLETVPAPLGRLISKRLSIPTIGIGAGVDCDGQVQVVHDMLGLFTDFLPRHAKRYALLADATREAMGRYAQEVREGTFPTEKESFSMDESVLGEL
ncbi:MAG: 3-methyl-2-oxobutanoate hydroxymethyltransferase, partial [Chloroflexi bacterium]|nr:3-methyl-2-oxobutanoate hydroxymethyltransferase [Chloroflexota bacterium]